MDLNRGVKFSKYIYSINNGSYTVLSHTNTGKWIKISTNNY